MLSVLAFRLNSIFGQTTSVFPWGIKPGHTVAGWRGPGEARWVVFHGFLKWILWAVGSGWRLDSENEGFLWNLSKRPFKHFVSSKEGTPILIVSGPTPLARESSKEKLSHTSSKNICLTCWEIFRCNLENGYGSKPNQYFFWDGKNFFTELFMWQTFGMWTNLYADDLSRYGPHGAFYRARVVAPTTLWQLPSICLLAENEKICCRLSLLSLDIYTNHYKFIKHLRQIESDDSLPCRQKVAVDRMTFWRQRMLTGWLDGRSACTAAAGCLWQMSNGSARPGPAIGRMESRMARWHYATSALWRNGFAGRSKRLAKPQSPLETTGFYEVWPRSKNVWWAVTLADLFWIVTKIIEPQEGSRYKA